MNRNIVILFCVLSFLFIPNKVFADSNATSEMEELDEKKSDYLQIIGLEGEIIGSLREIIRTTKGESLPDDFRINFESSKKIYIEPDIFSLKTSETEDVLRELKDSTYMWLLTLSIGDDTYQINIAKGLPLDPSVTEMLTDKEIQQINKNEGKWIISGIELIQNETIDYEQTVDNALRAISYNTKNAEIVICGGLEHIRYPVALIMKDNNVDLLIPLSDLQVEGTAEQIESIKPDSADKNDEVYLYDGMMKAVNNKDNSDGRFSGGDLGILLMSNSSETKYSIVLVVIILSFIPFSLLVYGIIKSKNKKYSKFIQGEV